jgi:hypothetical protein
MPYVKISDPNVIDLAAWHQVINVVNQHSDSLSSITNNFGVQGTGTIDWNGENDYVNQFDPGSQKILYGRTKLTIADLSTLSETGNHIFYGETSFIDQSGTTAFSAKPIITATIQFGSQTVSAINDTNHNVIFNLFGVTDSKFSFRITRANSNPAGANTTTPLTGYFYLNWVATGPR